MKDDILREIIRKVELESPSKDFVKNVMMMCYEADIKLSNYDLFRIWLKKSLPYAAAIFIFVFVTTILFVTGITFEPEVISNFFSSLGLGFINTLSIIRLTTIGLIFGLGSSLVLFYNKVKQQKLERVL